MIFVDSSVWIDHFRGHRDRPHVQALRGMVMRVEPIVVGDVVLLELLQGAPDSEKASRIEAGMQAFSIEPVLDQRLAVIAARHYRTMRKAGRTIRKTVDLMIGTFCLDRGYALLHNDRDFDPMHDLLGLRRAALTPA